MLILNNVFIFRYILITEIEYKVIFNVYLSGRQKGSNEGSVNVNEWFICSSVNQSLRTEIMYPITEGHVLCFYSSAD